VLLGDLKLGSRIVRGLNRSTTRQRAFIAIDRKGALVFSYGELTPERAARFDTFIGGLYSLYNDLEEPPAYRGAYSMNMVLRHDGRLEVLMSREGLTLDQTRSLVRRRGFLAAYMPDYASKSCLIIPGEKPLADAGANWISGGVASFVHAFPTSCASVRGLDPCGAQFWLPWLLYGVEPTARRVIWAPKPQAGPPHPACI